MVDVDEEVEGREASWRAMEVRGSCMDFRALSRFLRSALGDGVLLAKEAYLRSSGSSSSCADSFRFSEYHGLRSLADGASGNPLSVSDISTFLVALIAAAIAFYQC